MGKRDFIVYAVDFDGTLCESVWPGIGAPNMSLINHLIKRRRQGNKIILWTCREGERLQEAVEWCRGYGLEFDAVNSNIPEMIEWYGNDTRKIGYDVLIDDKAVNKPKYHVPYKEKKMFDFIKKFKKECVSTHEKLEKAEEEIEEPVKQEKPITAIIDGLLYDTSKAIKILEFFDTAGCGMYWINKTLYMTSNKRFFYTDNWGTLKKLSDDEAKTILSKHPDKYQEIFGKVEEA